MRPYRDHVFACTRASSNDFVKSNWILVREDLDWDACSSIPSDLLQGGVGSYSVGRRRIMDMSLSHDHVGRLHSDGCDAVEIITCTVLCVEEWRALSSGKYVVGCRVGRVQALPSLGIAYCSRTYRSEVESMVCTILCVHVCPSVYMYEAYGPAISVFKQPSYYHTSSRSSTT